MLQIRAVVLLALFITARLLAAEEAPSPEDESASYKAAGDFMRTKKFELAEPLLEAARRELPESIAVLSASAYCAESQAKTDRALLFYKQILRYSLDGRTLLPRDLIRVETAREKLKELDPVADSLLRCSTELMKDAEALEKEGRDPNQTLSALSQKILTEAIGRDDADRRNLLAERGYGQVVELQSKGKWEEAIKRIEGIETQGVTVELSNQIAILGRVLRQQVQAEEAFIQAAKRWNAYVSFTKDTPNDLDGRNKMLWEIKKMVTGSSLKRLVGIEERVSQEIIIVEEEMAKKVKK